MSQTATEEGAVARKRKIKFSEGELDILIEEVANNHEKLFGKLSLKVPEADKRRIWTRIRDKVNAVGVTHRSIDDLKKRWYDLRSRAKEKVAERLKEAKGTGGGGPTVPDNTPQEDMIEATIDPEAVVGVTILDTSGAACSTQDAAEVNTDDSDVGDSTQPNQETAVSKPVSPPPKGKAPAKRRATVAPLQPMEVEQDTSTAPTTSRESASHTPTPQAHVRAGSRRRPRSPTMSQEAGSHNQWGGVESQMVRVQRVQARHMGAINLQMTKMNSNITAMADSVRELTTAIVEAHRESNNALLEVARVMHEGHTTQRKRHRQFLTCMEAYTRSNNKISTSVSHLSRRSVGMQIEMAHCCGDVSKALGQITTAVEVMQASTGVQGDVTGEEGSEASSLSSITAPLNTVRRSSSRRQAPPAASGNADAEAGERHLGVRGRRR